jgi:hypothetical protein
MCSSIQTARNFLCVSMLWFVCCTKSKYIFWGFELESAKHRNLVNKLKVVLCVCVHKDFGSFLLRWVGIM